jgi:hypothetical protein
MIGHGANFAYYSGTKKCDERPCSITGNRLAPIPLVPTFPTFAKVPAEAEPMLELDQLRDQDEQGNRRHRHGEGRTARSWLTD